MSEQEVLKRASSIEPLVEQSSTNIIENGNGLESTEAKKIKIDPIIQSDLNKLILETNNEILMGLSEFVLPDDIGFKGIIKSRFNDFLVNEIDLKGNVIHYECELPNCFTIKPVEDKEGVEHKVDENKMDLGESKVEKVEVESKPEGSKAEDLSPQEPKAEEFIPEEPISLLPPEFYDELKKLYIELVGSDQITDLKDTITKTDNLLTIESYLSALKELVDSKGKSHSGGITIPIALATKPGRTQLHQHIRSTCDTHLETTAVPDLNYIRYRFLRGNKDKKKNAVRANKKDQKKDFDRFTYFVLYKENRDTMDVLNNIARTVNKDTKGFAFAGTKDKRGVTVQLCSVDRINRARLEGLNKSLRNACVAYHSSGSEPMRLGELSGNRFTLVVRDLQLNQPHTHQKKDLDNIEAEIENTLIKFQQSPGFINYFGMQRFGTTSVSTHLIGIELLSMNYENVINLILDPKPGDSDFLSQIREHWKETKDAQSTLEKMPNYLIAERAILNAFAMKDNDTRDCLGAIRRIPRSLRLMYCHAYQSYVWNFAISKRLQVHGFKPVVGDLIRIGEGKDDVKLLKESDQLDQYNITQVVLPLPGHAILYPAYEGDLKDLYENIMKPHGLNPKKMEHREREWSLTGDYRNVIIQPKEFQWQFYKYTDPTLSLVQTDIDLINKVAKPQSIPDGDKLALTLEFSLPPSGYATMMLRELMKQRTEKAFMANSG